MNPRPHRNRASDLFRQQLHAGVDVEGAGDGVQGPLEQKQIPICLVDLGAAVLVDSVPCQPVDRCNELSRGDVAKRLDEARGVHQIGEQQGPDDRCARHGGGLV